MKNTSHIPNSLSAITAERARLQSELAALDAKEKNLATHNQVADLVNNCLAEVTKITGQKHSIADLVILMRGPVKADRTKRFNAEDEARLHAELEIRLVDQKDGKKPEAVRALAKRYGFSTQTITAHMHKVKKALAAKTAIIPAPAAQTPDPIMQVIKPETVETTT